MTVSELLGNKTRIKIGDKVVSGTYFKRESQTFPHGLTVEIGEHFVMGGGSTKAEARQNAIEALEAKTGKIVS